MRGSVRALPPGWGLALIRVMAGIILIVASMEKFTGGGFDGFARVSTALGLPLPQLWGVWIPLQELIGGALILSGLGARWVALLFVCEFAVNALVLKTTKPAPFGGWDSMRIDLMLLATSVALVVCGPGAFALENVLWKRRRAAPPVTRATFSDTPA
jgi:putative oxidoreductase